ncbi:hypothetical protein [Pseudooceanicola sp.]|uniref:hypothetical protein n=1 Tax=Pseudooceanicola sp. TaxID=1914328 RepID=UPI00261594E5|nr:hypothetical protein [Pseudooceanicola sp.]MDF1854806.1 hypothetical protein [Pseudooceanicola sp.]
MTEFFKLTHLTRGSWFARGVNSKTLAVLGTEPIPILPDREAGAFDWQAPLGPTFTGLESEGGAAWWMAHEHEAWCAALIPDVVVWVRQVLPDGRDDTAAGRCKGVWRLAEVDIAPSHLLVRLGNRIGEVR